VSHRSSKDQEGKTKLERYNPRSNGKQHTAGTDFLPVWGYPSEEAMGDPHLAHTVNPMRVIRQRLWVVMLAAAVVTGVVTGYSFLQTPVYEASTQIFLEPIQKDTNDTSYLGDVGSDAEGINTISLTMAEVIMSRPVAEGIVEKLDAPLSADAVQAGVTATPVADTQFIDVTYQDTDPERAQQVANAIGDVFAEQISEIQPTADSVTATTWEQAELPGGPISPNPERNALLALAAGLMLGVGLALLLDYLDDGWKSPEEVEQVVGRPNLGAIPAFRIRKDRREQG
jgi:capsular polysaccharide biosynthesis protein